MKRNKNFLTNNYINSYVLQTTKQSYCMYNLYRRNVVVKLFSNFSKILVDIFKNLKYNLSIKRSNSITSQTTMYVVVKH